MSIINKRAEEESEPILRAEDLEKYFSQNNSIIDSLLNRGKGDIQAVDGVDLSLHSNQRVGIIGESVCGKTTLLKTLIGLHQPTGGELYFNGERSSEFSKADWKEYRRNIQMIFQDPYNSLNPKFTIRESVEEPLKIHNIEYTEERIREVLEQVELKPVDRFLDRYPAELSGGERQRVSIAKALVIEPEVILADEPVSMLDVSTQASVLELLAELTDEYGIALVYISHDLSTVADVCRTINVMYLGRVVESAPVKEILNDPKHPYTQALVNACPIPDPFHERKRTDVESTPKEPVNLGKGCRFRDRCPEAMDICEKKPEFIEIENQKKVACHLHYDHEQTDGNGRTMDE
jgi:peptide/nickel transport system ATP-binding protein